jgi:hypothetical protein
MDAPCQSAPVPEKTHTTIECKSEQGTPFHMAENKALETKKAGDGKMLPDLFEENVRFLESSRAFLGREFLTWLWFHTETHNHLIKIDLSSENKSGATAQYRLFLDDKIVLSAAGGSFQENALKGGSPAYAAEALVSLNSGKLVQEARFVMQNNDRQWSWTIRSEDLSLRNVKLPSLQETDPAAHLIERVRLTQELVDVVESLFRQFYALRSEKSFEQEQAKLVEWLEHKNTLN